MVEPSWPGILGRDSWHPGTAAQLGAARVQCVDTKARKDWRRDPIVAITALGS